MDAPADERVLTARWIFPATAPPLPGGTVTIRGERIVSVEAKGGRTADVDFGNAAIIPGLVNAHTHLDLSGMRGAVPPSSDFVGWLREIIDYRHKRSSQQALTEVRAGLDECLRFGTTLVGDIAAGGLSWDALATAPVWAVCFREVLGLPTGRVSSAWVDLGNWMEGHPDTPTCRAGVSPHAPYSVHKALIEASARLWPVCIHLAESIAERDLLESRAGPFIPLLRDLGVWDPSGLAPSFDWVVWKTSRAPAVLLAHGNHLPVSTLVPPNTTIVYCPRTHAAFGHPPHPFREFLSRGIRVALGTDSLASNPDLDLLAEARFVHRASPDLSGDEILRMATINGAEALGFADVTGSLEPGKSADMVVAPLPDREAADPHLLLLASDLEAAPRQTMWRGVLRGADFSACSGQIASPCAKR
jgi:cytosine/adenosine deaminase-related metal-dependent hydrolase